MDVKRGNVMGEGITGFVTTKSGTSQVTIFIRGRISKKCQDELKTLVEQWAKKCKLKLDSVNVTLNPVAQ